MNLRPRARALTFLVLFGAACGGPPTPSPIEGEPICPDFEVGATRAVMRGSLRFPVTLTVRDGKTPVTRATLDGRRSKDEPGSRILLANDDAEYEIEWAQCENQRAPRALSLGRDTKDTAEYACGNATVYKTDKLVTRKGDAASRTVQFVAPPKPECWESEVPPAEPPTLGAAGAEQAAADAGADDAGAADTTAVEAGAADAGAVDAGAAGAATAPADAGPPRGGGAARDAGAGGAPKPPRAGGGDAGSPPQGS
ncbi:hypothetical protein SOCE26_041840 [Sorangium cellulosum]|uniref:Secreted protein n=1 Tax=Sorangium cellulosum TaxID=56 RepID=A0A2L0ETX3_SORCE|nr:hypothetical protein [Sorangium cellulosum]AUX42751.1 hypothetical protein SOCE26_041840 [Sorangium cellulosum]